VGIVFRQSRASLVYRRMPADVADSLAPLFDIPAESPSIRARRAGDPTAIPIAWGEAPPVVAQRTALARQLTPQASDPFERGLMQHVTRRSLIGQALAAGAGATVVSSIEVPDVADAEASRDPASGYDPGYLAGTVLSRKPGDRFVVSVADGTKEMIRVADRAVVWKKGTQGELSLEPGDNVRARGLRSPDGVLAVTGAWVDIHSFQAKVARAERSQIAVELSRWPGRQLPIAIRPNSTVGKQGGGFVRGHTSHLREKDALQVIGYGDLADGRFVATRVFVFEGADASSPPGPEAALPSRDASQAARSGQCRHYHFGVTSWFDCSDGACDGDCPRCNSNHNQMAWPRLKYCSGPGECNADCGGNTCDASCCTHPRLPSVKCGRTVPIHNPCNGTWVKCVVTDCGPCVRCVSPFGCKGFKTVKFDLTAAAFSKIAPLNSGLADVRATTFGPC